SEESAMHRVVAAPLGVCLAAQVLLAACAPASAPPAASQPASQPAPAAAAPVATSGAPAAASAPAAQPAPAAPAAPPSLTPLRMGTQTSVNDIAMWLGAERGYFQQEGVELDLVPFSNASEMVPAIATEQLEAGGIAFNPAAINAVARGVPLKVVLDRATFRPGFGTQAMVVRKQTYDAGRGRTLGELKGLTGPVLPP